MLRRVGAPVCRIAFQFRRYYSGKQLQKLSALISEGEQRALNRFSSYRLLQTSGFRSMGAGSSKGEEGGERQEQAPAKKTRFSLKRFTKRKRAAEGEQASAEAGQSQPAAEEKQETAEKGTETVEGEQETTAAGSQTTAEVSPEQQPETEEPQPAAEQAEEPPQQAAESSQQAEEPPQQEEESSQQAEEPPQPQEEPQEQPEQASEPASVPAEEQQTTAAVEDDNYVEAVVAKVSEFGENEMREVDIGDFKALLVRQDGEFSAVGPKCTHYGAPLVKGYLGNGRVRCPWHGACFSVRTGDIEEFPGLDGIPRFEVRVEGDDIIIRAEKRVLEAPKRTGRMCVAAPEEDQRTFLIVGGGPASVACAETLRQEGFKGRIALATRESDLPYDRPKLSKAMHLTPDAIALRSADFFSEHNIDVLLGKEATSVSAEDKTVNFADGSSLSYDTLLLATGSRPRTLPIPGFDLQNVFLLREPSHANRIAEAAQGKKVVVIGTSFIGMEVAAYLADKAASISCIDITAVPFERVLGARVGGVLQGMLEENGVKFFLSAGVKELVGEEGKLTGVTLPSGETLEAEICIAGVGVVPATGFLKDSGVPMTDRGEVIVDEHMKAAEGVYAAGDIVRFPLPLIDGDTNIGHWQIAHNHGRVAARNMVGKDEKFNSIPYFWTVLFGKSLRYCGHALSWDEIIYDGNPEERKFAAYFVKDDKVLAVASLNFDPAVSRSAELMYQGKMPSGSQLRENPSLSSHL